MTNSTDGSPILVVGSTGFLGGEIVRQLRAMGRNVRALMRPSSDPARTASLRQTGAQSALGDLKDEASLAGACRGVRVVVSTATALLSRVPGDSIESVDLRGQLNLVAAAERAGVSHFVFVSFPPLAFDIAYQRAKRAVETRLRNSTLSFTILQPTSFAEVWLGPHLGFDPLHGRVSIYGDGTARTNWVCMVDVARIAAAAVDGGAFATKTLPVGGPDALSYHEVLDLFASRGAGNVSKEYVSDTDLERKLGDAADPRDEAITAVMLSMARGQRISSEEVRALWPGPFTSVNEYVARVIAAG